ncbi:luciferin 4-monooxygenase-like [Aphomia sociella]
MPNLRLNDNLRWYMEDLSHRVVANTGVPTDRHHLGKIILQSLQDDLNFILQIDGATDEKENSESVLKRSLRCACAFKNVGLQYADVVVIMAPNNLDVAIPFYACLYLGLIIAPVDINLSSEEIQQMINNYKPKMVFCQNQKSSMIQEALDNSCLDTKIITFDKGNNYPKFKEWLEKYGDEIGVKNFRAADFDPAETVAFLTATSGTTGLPKAAALTHKNFCIGTPVFCEGPVGERRGLLGLLAFPYLYLSLELSFGGRLRRCARTCQADEVVGTSGPYAYLPMEPWVRFSTILPPLRTVLGTPKVRPLARMLSPKPAFLLINIETQHDISEPNTPGELWIKGPSVFKGYYNNPEATSDILTEDGWLKTGDVMYRDEHCNYYFVDRIKALLKYRNHHVSPVELENVIRRHYGVSDVAVCGVADRECGELPVACVVRRPGHSVTAQEIKDLVKNSLTDTKQLRGGVIFMDQLPLTVTSKIARYKLTELVKNLPRE